MREPYVISEDIVILLERWAEEKGFALPDHRFFSNLRQRMLHHLECIFGHRCVDMIPEGVLAEGMQTLVTDTQFPAVSIDRAYTGSSARVFEVSRFVNRHLEDIGEDSRIPGYSLEQQAIDIAQSGLRNIVLVDDVVYTGHCMGRVIDLFRHHGICVRKTVAGIVVGNGRHALHTRDVDVRWVRFYSEVVDEVCERDFYPGVPYSGRAVACQGMDTGAPYILPFGKPIEWASIPAEFAVSFSKFCIQQSISLWREIERVSGRMVRCLDVGRLPIGMLPDETSFVYGLEHCLHTI